MSTPFVSVVVPTAKRVGVLADCLESLVAQDHPGEYEVIVVENGPDPSAEATVAAHSGGDRPTVRYLYRPEPDANGARNEGIRAARGDVICLVDDDVIAPPAWLAAMTAAVAAHDADCVGGAVRPRYERRPPRTCGAHVLAGCVLDEGPDAIDVDEVWGCNMAIRRSAIERVGELRERLPVLHESEWEGRLLRSGGRIVYAPEAWLWHRRLASDLRLRYVLRDSFRLGYGVVALGQQLTLSATLRLRARKRRPRAVARVHPRIRRCGATSWLGVGHPCRSPPPSVGDVIALTATAPGGRGRAARSRAGRARSVRTRAARAAMPMFARVSTSLITVRSASARAGGSWRRTVVAAPVAGPRRPRVRDSS